MPLDLKRDVLKKLTSVTIGVFCEKRILEVGPWWSTISLSKSELVPSGFGLLLPQPNDPIDVFRLASEILEPR
jgi:hypothetical protein